MLWKGCQKLTLTSSTDWHVEPGEKSEIDETKKANNPDPQCVAEGLTLIKRKSLAGLSRNLARWLLCNHESLCSEVKVGVAQANQSLDFIHSATQALPAKLTQFRKRFVKLSCGALMFARCE